MNILRKARAGTLESGDVLVTVAPSDELAISIESPVKTLFGDAMMDAVMGELDDLQVKSAAIHLDDQGALDCTLRARLRTALCRASAERGD